MARILVVEDETILRRNIVDRLRAEGHDLYDASNAEAGVELANLLAPDLILTDLRLPGYDGLELLRRVRAASARSMVVLMTAAGTRESAAQAIREGAYDYLHKPVELKQLVVLVERAVTHSRAMDRAHHQRAVGGRPLPVERSAVGDPQSAASEKPPAIRIDLPEGDSIRIDFDRDELSLEEINRRVILAAYHHFGGDIALAAARLGTTHERVHGAVHHGESTPKVDELGRVRPASRAG